MLKLKRYIFFTIVFSLLFTSLTGSEKPTENAVINAEVELLIICDVECSHGFQYSRQKLIDYWSVYMWDVNMRFKTLSGVNISFRVTSLHTVNDTTSQPFIEEVREEDGTIVLKSVWEKFAEWVYVNEKSFPGFDIALLVTGAKNSESNRYDAQQQSEHGKTACLKDDTTGRHLSTIAFSTSATWGYQCGSLEVAFAEILGAKYDHETECASDAYLMSTGECDNRQYMFSRCSDLAISEFVRTSQASCLTISAAPEMNVLKAATVTHPPTLDDQCVMITKIETAVALDVTEELGIDPCVISKCSILSNGKLTFLDWLFPVDNSPCGDGKYCFRGRCLPQGQTLYNIGSGKCLLPNNTPGDKRHPIMGSCMEDPTPLTQVRVQDEGRHGNILMTSAGPPVSPDDQDDCLSDDMFFEHVEGNLWYYSCLFSGKEYLGWDLLSLGTSEIFLLRRRFTDACVTVNSENLIKLDDNCDTEEVGQYWVFFNQSVIPLDLFSSKYNDGRATVNEHELLKQKLRQLDEL